MSTTDSPRKEHQNVPLPSSFVAASLTPPPTEDQVFTQAPRVITLLKDIQAGRHAKEQSWTEFQLAVGEYDEIELQLKQDKWLFGFVKDKIRYDHFGESRRLVVRRPTGVHELFIDAVEDAIRNQLKEIRNGSGTAATFAQKVRPARSTEIYFPVEDIPHSPKSKHEPDASFWHDDAQYPGVIIEVACSQKRKRMARLAEDYLLDSNASVQVVIGLDIGYGKEGGSRKATLSVRRTKVFRTAAAEELRVVQEVIDEAFRDDQGYPTQHPGLRLRLADFAHEELAQDELKDEDRELVISAQQLCEYLSAAENKVSKLGSLAKHSISPGVKKRKGSETPPDRLG